MPQVSHALRLQAWPFLLLACTLLAGFAGLLASAFPQLPVPEPLRFSWAGSLTLVVGGMVMSAWLFRSSGRALLLKKLAYQASHDALTGLANRTMFEGKLQQDFTLARQAEEVAERILQKIARPQQVGGHELYLSASIGISLLDDSETSPEKLIRQADMAMYKAKRWCGGSTLPWADCAGAFSAVGGGNRPDCAAGQVDFHPGL